MRRTLAVLAFAPALALLSPSGLFSDNPGTAREAPRSTPAAAGPRGLFRSPPHAPITTPSCWCTASWASPGGGPAGLNYWGGRLDLPAALRARGYEAWASGHERYGRAYPGLVPDWGESRRVHLLGHRMGGPFANRRRRADPGPGPAPGGLGARAGAGRVAGPVSPALRRSGAVVAQPRHRFARLLPGGGAGAEPAGHGADHPRPSVRPPGPGAGDELPAVLPGRLHRRPGE